MREVNIVIAGDLKNPFDVFDALQLKAQVWDKKRKFLTDFYSKMSKKYRENLWSWFVTGEKPENTPYHTPGNVLGHVGMRLQSFKGGEDVYGPESKRLSRDTLVKQGLFPENIPFHILTFKLPENFLGKFVFRGEVQKFRWSVQGLVGELSKEEMTENVKARPTFIVLDEKPQSAYVPVDSLGALELAPVCIQDSLRDRFAKTLRGFMSTKMQFVKIQLRDDN